MAVSANARRKSARPEPKRPVCISTGLPGTKFGVAGAASGPGPLADDSSPKKVSVSFGAELDSRLLIRRMQVLIHSLWGFPFQEPQNVVNTHAHPSERAGVRKLKFARDNDHCYGTWVDACWVAAA